MSDAPPPPPPPPPPPGWQPPDAPTTATPPTAPLPPAAPPAAPPPFPPAGPPPAAPQYPAGPPQAPGWAPPAGPPPAAPADGTAPAGRKSRVGLVVGLLVVLLLVAGGVAAALVLGGSSAEVQVTSCVIDADGTMTARGTVDGLGNGQSVQVDFQDAADGSTIRTTGVDSSSDGPWEATGRAGDSVQRITCVASVSD